MNTKPKHKPQTAIFEVWIRGKWVEWDRIKSKPGQDFGEGDMFTPLRPQSRVRVVR
jgi:hypothetical protein